MALTTHFSAQTLATMNMDIQSEITKLLPSPDLIAFMGTCHYLRDVAAPVLCKRCGKYPLEFSSQWHSLYAFLQIQSGLGTSPRASAVRWLWLDSKATIMRPVSIQDIDILLNILRNCCNLKGLKLGYLCCDIPIPTLFLVIAKSLTQLEVLDFNATNEMHEEIMQELQSLPALRRLWLRTNNQQFPDALIHMQPLADTLQEVRIRCQ